MCVCVCALNYVLANGNEEVRERGRKSTER